MYDPDHPRQYYNGHQPLVIKSFVDDDKRCEIEFVTSKGVLGIASSLFLPFNTVNDTRVVFPATGVTSFNGDRHDRLQWWQRHHSGLVFSAEVKTITLRVKPYSRIFVQFCMDTRGMPSLEELKVTANKSPLQREHLIEASFPRSTFTRKVPVNNQYYEIIVLPKQQHR